jgi:4-diphosphocytidyl-2-C-methyl-D-erythritol kinase
VSRVAFPREGALADADATAGRSSPAGRRAEEVARAAPAKINLYLHVTGRRPDGYHELDSLVAFAAVHDTVIARASATLSLDVQGPQAAGLETGPENLVWRAASLLARQCGVRDGAQLTLVKRLPPASGVGGGSADAAAALAALRSLWALSIAESDLMRLALALGADVPVCLFGRAAIVGGIGDSIAPAPALATTALLLVNPGRSLSTAAVFARREGPFSLPARSAPGDSPRALAAMLAGRGNDLTAGAQRLVPEIADVLAAIAAQPGCLLARMSGSGATCFGLFADETDAAQAASALRARAPNWWITPSTLLDDTRRLAPAMSC